jgi:peroxiredoxin
MAWMCSALRSSGSQCQAGTLVTVMSAQAARIGSPWRFPVMLQIGSHLPLMNGTGCERRPPLGACPLGRRRVLGVETTASLYSTAVESREQFMSLTIQEQSDQIKAAAPQHIPAESYAVFARDQSRWRAQGVPADAVAVGQRLEDFTLPDATGKDVSLTELAARGPVVLVFYRGGWCPFCNLALRQYQSELVPRLGGYGATLAAISPQKPDESLTTVEKHDLQFAVLSDTGARIARKLGIGFQLAEDVLEAQRALGQDITLGNTDGSADLPLPTVVIIDAQRMVRFVDVQPDYTSRTEVVTILSALGELS